jgi:predicted MFS family arabinose efflux permease
MLASTYITQYIGVAFILSAAVAILRKKGVALDQLALLNLIILPLAGKVFYAPVIDKYRLFMRGTYRSWLIMAQSCMVLLLLVAGTLNIETQFIAIIVLFGLYGLFLSIQDVSVDGLSCKLFDSEARKFANSIQFSGNLCGNIIGGGLILMFYPWLEWRGSLWLLAGLTAVSLVLMFLFNEPEDEAQSSATAENKQHLLRTLGRFIKQHKRWFTLMALYPIGSTCGFALLNPLLVDSGWALADIGFAMKIYGSIIGLFSALLATPFITRVGRVNALISVIIVQAFALVCIIPLTLGVTGKPMVYTIITLHFIGFPALLVVSSTLMMDKAAHSARKATLFTLQFTVASLCGFAYSSISLAIAKHTGYTAVVVTGVVLTVGIAIAARTLLAKSERIQTSNTQHAVQ